MQLFGDWQVGEFMSCQTDELVPTKGWTKRGVGLYRNALGLWWLVHLNTGHGIVRLGIEDLDGLGHELRHEIIVWADAVVDAADWDFDGIHGWRNRNPDLPAKLQEITNMAPAGMITTPAAANVRHNPRAARKLAISRMDA